MPVIEQLLKESKAELSFTFKRGENLEQKSSRIPNSAGIMLVFCNKTLTIFDIDLEYTINGKEYVLCYYGMTGGSGEHQGLKKYIINTATGDIPRDKKWNEFMYKKQIDELYIWCILLDNPGVIKNKITKSLVRIIHDVNKKKDKKVKVKPLMKQRERKP